MKRINLSIKPGTSISQKTGNWREYMRPFLDKEVCIGCNRCNEVCPDSSCFPNSQNKKNKNGYRYYVQDMDYCKGCGLCAKECPVKAIKMKPEFKHKD